MLYDTSFEYAGAVVLLAILSLFLIRRPLGHNSSRNFLYITIASLSACIFDIISAYTISFTEAVPLALNYFVTCMYLFAYVSCVALFLLYTDSLAKISALERPLRNFIRIFIIALAVVIFTSPLTHLYIYFDENMVYRHGPAYNVAYVVAAIMLILSIIIIIKGRVRFSTSQRAALIVFVAGIVTAIVIQFFNPWLLLGGFSNSIMLILLFMAFENPAYYYYRDTRCFNAYSFYQIVKFRYRAGKAPGIVVFEINDYARISGTLRNAQKENLTSYIADTLSSQYGHSAFALSSHRFAVVCTRDSHDLSYELAIAEYLTGRFSTSVNLIGRNLTISISSAILPREYIPENSDELASIIGILLTEKADRASEKERVERALAKTTRKNELSYLIRDALENDKFMVYYQPIYKAGTNSFESAEALLRLQDSEGNFVSPEEFIPAAEESGYILQVGEMVFEKVCSMLASIDYRAMGLKYIEVNLSPIQCDQESLTDILIEIMKKHNIDPAAINFEITETANTQFTEGSMAMKNMLSLSHYGVAFSIDDFGSGFASMDHLFQLPVKLVKIDRSILWEAMENENAMTVLKNTFRMIQELHKEVLVEGIETKEMQDILLSYGCNYMQGFYFSKPLPEGDFLEFIRANNS